MKTLIAPLLALVSILAYFEAATRFGLYQRWPVIPLLGCAIACGLAVHRLRRRATWQRWTALAVTLGLSGLYAWYTLDYSSYPSHATAVAVGEDLGDRLAGLELAAHDGGSAPVLRRGAERGTLLVFYRGHW